VISGQQLVDIIEDLPVDSNTNRPLKDVIISHCGDLEYATSKLMNFFENLLIDVFSESNKSKKRQISPEDESENDNNESGSATDNDDKKKKSKHSKKSKKKEKHRRKKEVKQANEDENELNQNPPQPDEITEQKNLLKSTSNNNDERTARYETHISQFLIISSNSFRTNSYRSAKKVDSNGRPVKGRGFMVS
jgi:hypothetical protein